jgi:hypothetical protein
VLTSENRLNDKNKQLPSNLDRVRSLIDYNALKRKENLNKELNSCSVDKNVAKDKPNDLFDNESTSTIDPL